MTAKEQCLKALSVVYEVYRLDGAGKDPVLVDMSSLTPGDVFALSKDGGKPYSPRMCLECPIVLATSVEGNTIHQIQCRTLTAQEKIDYGCT